MSILKLPRVKPCLASDTYFAINGVRHMEHTFWMRCSHKGKRNLLVGVATDTIGRNISRWVHVPVIKAYRDINLQPHLSLGRISFQQRLFADQFVDTNRTEDEYKEMFSDVRTANEGENYITLLDVQVAQMVRPIYRRDLVPIYGARFDSRKMHSIWLDQITPECWEQINFSSKVLSWNEVRESIKTGEFVLSFDCPSCLLETESEFVPLDFVDLYNLIQAG